MNGYCECANRTTEEHLKEAKMYVAVNKKGEIVCIGGSSKSIPVYRSVINGQEVTVFTSNVVPHERNR